MAKQSELELPKQEVSETVTVTLPKAEKPMAQIEQVSSRSLPSKLIAIATELGKNLVSNQAYKVNGTYVLWVGSEKKIYYGPDAVEGSGDTLLQASQAAGIA